MSKKRQYDIARILEKGNFAGIVEQAKASLLKNGGEPTNASMLVHVGARDNAGAYISARGDFSIEEPFTAAFNELNSKGFDDTEEVVVVTVTLIDGRRLGLAYSDTLGFDVEAYRKDAED